jgi:hypothetical protein
VYSWGKEVGWIYRWNRSRGFNLKLEIRGNEDL